MFKKLMIITGLLISIPTSTFAATPFVYHHVFTGKIGDIVEIPNAQYPCYIALTGNPNSPYNEEYHAAYSRGQCDLAQRLLNSDQTVKIWGDAGNRGDNPGIFALETIKTRVSWVSPPKQI